VPIVQFNERYEIIYPNKNGYLELNTGINFYLSCSNSNLVINLMIMEFNTIQVTCYGNDEVLYNGYIYKFGQFLCRDIPKSDIIVTPNSCKTLLDKIVYVGFRMGNVFLPQYGFCFDTIKMISHYTWYEGRTPYINSQVEYGPIPEITGSPNLYHNVDVRSRYYSNVLVSNRKNILMSFFFGL